MYNRTYETNPELWDDNLSFFAKIETQDSSQGILASGWHRRQIEFEYPTVRFRGSSNSVGVVDVDAHPIDPKTALKRASSYELEISLDSLHLEEAEELLRAFVPATEAGQMIQSMDKMNTRVSANRKDSPLGSSEHVSGAIDLLSLNLPARSGDMKSRLRFHQRWCRVFVTDKGTITLYRAFTDEEKPPLRWPHNCIWLNRGIEYYSQRTDNLGSVRNAIEAPIRYVQYNLENWRVEFEFWQDLPFQIANSDNLEDASDKLSIAQQEIGVLSSFITSAFLSLRNLERRVENNPIVTRDAELERLTRSYIEALRERIERYRESLAKASSLMANTAQSVQALASEETAKAANRTNAFITYASAVFFIPTLIISFYSMQIFEMDTEAHIPSTAFVALMCLGAVIIGILALLLARYRSNRSERSPKTEKAGPK